MYTGYHICEQRVIGPEGPTHVYLHQDRFYAPAQGELGYCVTEGHCQGVRHIYGPQGYTQFYLCDGYLYGPQPCLPWKEVLTPAPLLRSSDLNQEAPAKSD